MNKDRKELVAMVACVATLKSKTTDKERRIYLTQQLTDQPFLVKYWRAAYSQNAFKEQMRERLWCKYNTAIDELTQLILTHSLHVCGVSPDLLVRVFEKCDLAPIENLIATAGGLCVRVTSCDTDTATFVLDFNGVRFANGSFVLNKQNVAALRALQDLIPFEIPSCVRMG